MRSRKLERIVLMSVLVSTLSIPAATATEGTRGSRGTPPDTSAQESRRVVPFRTDKTDSWMCQNVSAFWCSRATQSSSSSNPSRPSRGRG